MSLFQRFGVDLSNIRVLLVEDNEFELNLAKASLKQLGFEGILFARDGREAFETIEHFPNINLIISDWNMPNLNGLEFLRIVHERWPGIPFVMMTGNDSLEQVAEARRSGVYAYVLKPFTLDGLQTKIIAAIRKRLAIGGDRANDDDRVFLEALEHVDAIAANLGDDTSQDIPEEIERFGKAVEDVLFSPGSDKKFLVKFRKAAEAVVATPGLDADSRALVETIVTQLSEFIKVIGTPNPVQQEIVKLHIEVTLAIVSGKVESMDQPSRDKLLQGLQMAVTMALA